MPSRFPLLTSALVAAAVAIFLLPPGVAAALQFDRAAVAHGEVWRLVTAHLTHFDASHLVWDVGVLAALGWAGERQSGRATALALALAAVAITGAVWAWQPQFATYRGLSGLDCALYGLQAAHLLRQPGRTPRLIGVGALAALGAKCVIELSSGTTLFAQGNGYDPVPLAHLIGGLAGVLAPGLDSRLRARARRRQSRTRIVANRTAVPT